MAENKCIGTFDRLLKLTCQKGLVKVMKNRRMCFGEAYWDYCW